MLDFETRILVNRLDLCLMIEEVGLLTNDELAKAIHKHFHDRIQMINVCNKAKEY